MTSDERINQYTRDLSRSLKGLPKGEREDIVAEIAAHLEYRDGEGKLDIALADLGAAAHCAQSYRDALLVETAVMDQGPVITFGTLAKLATRRMTALLGLILASFSTIIAIALAFSAVAELFDPQTVGLWVSPDNPLDFYFGKAGPNVNSEDVLGRWYVPVASICAIGFYLISQKIGLICLKLMLTRTRPLE
jgi:hypothetical protein